MSPEARAVFWPMFALFCWTVFVSVYGLGVRGFAVLRRTLGLRYFELFQGEAPPIVQKATNHYRNLMELPPLFYVACLLAIATGAGDAWFVSAAWLYVALRVLHGLVHLTINKVPPRFAFFIGSYLVLGALWMKLALS